MRSKPMQLDSIYKNCDYCQTASERLLYIPEDIWQMWTRWTRVKEDVELLALFNAEALKDNQGWHITKIWLPRQRVTSVECEILEHSGEANGMIHSHHSMPARMSAQDERALLPAYTVSAVSNHNGDIEAYERVTLPCGGISFKKLEVLVDLAKVEDEEATAMVEAAIVEPEAVLELPNVPKYIDGYREQDMSYWGSYDALDDLDDDLNDDLSVA